MTTALMNSTAGASVPAHRFDVDPEIKGLRKELRLRKRSMVRWLALTFFSILLIPGVLVTAIYFIGAAKTSSTETLLKGIINAVVVVAIALFSRWVIKATASPENKERRTAQRSLKKSMRSARSLGDIPSLTKEHVESGLRLDRVMEGRSPAWSRAEVEAVRALLFADLNRETAILSFIEYRGMTTATQVTAALQELESSTLKPLQGGWL